MEKMSVTRALSELKKIDDRINRECQSGLFVGIVIGKDENTRPNGNFKSVQELNSRITSSFQTVEGLIERRAKIKSAIILSNATTKVKVGGVEMTVAEAIELKSSVAQRVVFLNTMRNQLVQANRAVEENNRALDATIEKNLAAVYGNDKGKVDTSQYDAIVAPQKKNKEASVYDPAAVSTKIEKLDKFIADVQTELDFTLSEINARTEIEI